MTEFFLPLVEPDDRPDETYELIRRLVEQMTGWAVGDRRIFRINFVHDGQPGAVTVGEPDACTGETVVAIFESNAYLVCTPNRGVLRGEPIHLAKHEAQHVEEFD